MRKQIFTHFIDLSLELYLPQDFKYIIFFQKIYKMCYNVIFFIQIGFAF